MTYSGSPAARAKARAVAVDKAKGRLVMLDCGHGAYYDDIHVLDGRRRWYCCDRCRGHWSLADTRSHYRVKHSDDCQGCYKCCDEPGF